MEAIAIWFFFALVVGLIAGAKGRSAAGWFVLACLISPLIAGVIVAALPNLKHEQMMERLVEAKTPHLAKPRSKYLFGKISRVVIERDDAFHPDGVYAGIPYKVGEKGTIDAVMQGRVVRFSNLDRFMSAVGKADG